jgi:hypothetical protein
MRLKGRTCIIHYAKDNRAPDERWRDAVGRVMCVGRGPGPRNVLVKTYLYWTVVVPRGNVRVLR